MSKAEPLRRIYISRPEAHWKIIDKKIEELGKSDLNSYLRGRISLLINRFEQYPESISNLLEKKIEKQHYVRESSFKILQKISYEMEVPISTIIDRLIIDNLILPKP
jgi:uncharacterized membrane-anchored protein YjiN (DUF445 family)